VPRGRDEFYGLRFRLKQVSTPDVFVSEKRAVGKLSPLDETVGSIALLRWQAVSSTHSHSNFTEFT